jgi:hypothetical protein
MMVLRWETVKFSYPNLVTARRAFAHPTSWCRRSRLQSDIEQRVVAVLEVTAVSVEGHRVSFHLLKSAIVKPERRCYSCFASVPTGCLKLRRIA